jgi:hypothetical protein
MGMGLTTPPQKNIVTKPRRSPRPTQGCSASKVGVKTLKGNTYMQYRMVK